MISTLWDSSLAQQNNSNKPVGQLALTAAGASTGLLLQAIDLATVQNIGESINLELETFTPGTAPGGGNTVKMWWGFSSSGSKQPVELQVPQNQSLTCTLPTVANQRSVFIQSNIWIGARFLYVWFDQTALGAAVPVQLTLRVNGQTA